MPAGTTIFKDERLKKMTDMPVSAIATMVTTAWIMLFLMSIYFKGFYDGVWFCYYMSLVKG